MRIAIYGAGSLGTVLGAYLTQAGIDVDLISRNKAHIQALQQQGAHIVGKAQLIVGVKAFEPNQMQGCYDLLFLLTKQQENQKIATFLHPFLAKDGLLISMQNGIPEPALAQVLGPQRVAGCTIGWGSTLLKNGLVELTSDPSTFTFNLGMLSEPRKDLLTQVGAILSTMGKVTIEDNFLGSRWSKLLINAAFSGTATVLGTTFGEVTDDKDALRIVQLIIKECFTTGHSLGISFAPIQGKNIQALFDYHSRWKERLSLSLIPFAMKNHSNIKPSMLQDIERGKPCEIESINGLVSQEARRAGTNTPVNDLVVEIIQNIESKKAKPCWSNLSKFKAYLF